MARKYANFKIESILDTLIVNNHLDTTSKTLPIGDISRTNKIKP